MSPPSDDNLEEFGVDVAKSFEKVPRAHEVLMKDCIESYQEFFVTFLSVKAFFEDFDPNLWLSKMVKRPHDTLEERTKYLEQLLQEDNSEKSSISSEEDQILIEKLKGIAVELQRDVGYFTEALNLSCQILVELSSIPTMGSANPSPIIGNLNNNYINRGFMMFFNVILKPTSF